MEITVEKMALIREDFNPKNQDLNFNIDWAVEYKNTDQKDIKYDIHLKSLECFDVIFKISGLMKLQDLEKFNQQKCSQLIFHHACTLLMSIISLTRQSSYDLVLDNFNSAVNLNATF